MLIVSNRNDTTFGISPPVDSLATFSISHKDGTLTKLPLISAHGSFPRSFAMNKAGTLLATGLQLSGSLVVLEKNKTSGLFDKEVASIKFDKGADLPVCVVWDEEDGTA
jgi:6-phosphogluconolactonase (cycloisomerase 2 family)